ncbi:MAG: glycosyltransferase family 2 protein [Bacteroidota bacterium]
MHNYPRISVIMPSYQQARFLEESMLSVLDQGYPELEFIVIDGGSYDGSVEIIKRHSDRLAYWVSEKDNGQSAAINKGLRICTGELVTWLCSDDTYLPGTLFKFAELYRKYPEAGLFHGRSILFGRDRKAVVSGAQQSDLHLRYFGSIPFPQPGSFFTGKALKAVGSLDETLHFAMDYDLFARIALEMQVISVDDIFSRYRLHPSSKSMGQLDRFSAEWTKVFSRFMNSVSVSAALKHLLIRNGLILEDEPAYSHHRYFNEKEINRITCFFLFNNLIIYYEQTKRKEGIHFIEMIKEVDADFYYEINLQKLYFRLKYIPGSLIRLARKFTR